MGSGGNLEGRCRIHFPQTVETKVTCLWNLKTSTQILLMLKYIHVYFNIKPPLPQIFKKKKKIVPGRCITFILWLQVSWSAIQSPTKHRTGWFLRPLVPARPRKGAQLDRQWDPWLPVPKHRGQQASGFNITARPRHVLKDGQAKVPRGQTVPHLTHPPNK